MKLSREQELLFDFLKSGTSRFTDEVDYEEFLALLKRHKLLPLAESFLTVLPEGQKLIYKKELINWTIRAMYMFKVLQKLIVQFDEKQIPTIMLKGPLLSYYLYSNFQGRYYSDLDLLIDPSNLKEIILLMKKAGFSIEEGIDMSRLESHGKYNNDLVFRRREDRLIVEVHFGIYIEQLLHKGQESPFLESTEKVTIKGQDFRIMQAEYHLLYLCYHGAKHMFFRLSWLRDIAIFINSNKAQPARVVQLARSMGLEYVLGISLHMVRLYFDTKLASEFQDFIVEYKCSKLVKLNHRIIAGPGILAYEKPGLLFKTKDRREGIDRVSLRIIFIQLCYLVLLRKGFWKRARFLFYQISKRIFS